MKRKATTIEAGSCSRPARPRKALGACAQGSPSSTVAANFRVKLATVEQAIRTALKGTR